MAKKESDILLIRKYLNGELDARAMHQLEARAQDDPFLMDALEGYENAGGDQQGALADLNVRLQQRVEQKEVRRIIPFRILAIAASVLVVFTVGWLLMVKKNKTEKQPPIAANITPPTKTQPATTIAKDTIAAMQQAKQPASTDQNIAVVKAPAQTTVSAADRPAPAAAPVIVDDKMVLNEDAVAKADVTVVADTAKDTTPLNEFVVMNYKPEKKKEVLKDKQGNLSDGFMANSKVRPAATTEQKLISDVPGVSKTPGLSALSYVGYQKIYLQGRIIDEIDGQPLPGVSVRATGSSYGAVTDRNGKFYVPSDSLKRGLVVSRLGYNTTKINAPQGDSLKTISLAPNDFPLKGTAIASNTNLSAAHPQIGWSKYNKYLGDSAISPDGKTGSVELSFLVDKSGAITGTTILTGLSDAANKKAIDLVNKGPKWVGNANGKAEQVRLTVNF